MGDISDTSLPASDAGRPGDTSLAAQVSEIASRQAQDSSQANALMGERRLDEERD